MLMCSQNADRMQYKDYYKTMGLARDASTEDIKRAHRKLARQYHPDVSKEKNAEARFKEISEAYEVLRDPKKRAAYDQLGTRWQAGQDFRPPPEWNAGAAHPAGPGRGFDWTFEKAGTAGGEPGADFSDFFEALFKHGFATEPGGSGSSSRGGTQRPRSGSNTGSRRASFDADGDDLHAKILIDLEDAYLGRTKTITLQAVPGTPGLDAGAREVSFTVPKGVKPGQTIRLAGQGGAPEGTGQPGDLYLEVAFNPRAPGSANYRVERHDVYLDLPVAPWEAALGAQVQAPTPGGWVEVTVPPGSSSGRKLRLKGRGIPGSTPGDFYFVLQVVAPVATASADKAAYAAMAKHFNRFSPRPDWPS